MNRTVSVAGKSNFVPWANPDDILSRSEYLMIVFALHCVIKPVIVVVGVPSNVINCLVFCRQGLRDRMNVCLFTLSLVDLFLLIMSALFSISFYLETIDPVEWDGLYTYMQAYVSGVSQGFRTASGCITMVIAVERCLCVTFPLKAASLISTRSMAVIMVCIFCITQAGFFTMPARFVVISVNTSTSKFGLVSSDLYIKNQFFFTVFENIVMVNVIPIATFVIVSLATGLTVVKLRAAMRWRKTTSSRSEEGQGQHTALTKMLVLVSCVYVITTIPWVVFYLATLTVDDFSLLGRYYNFYMASIAVVYYFPYVNSSVNFFVYFQRSTRFRKDVLNMFGVSCRGQPADR